MCLGIPGRICEIIDEENALALIELGGVTREVNIACVIDENAPIKSLVNEWVLVHVGYAMVKIDEVEAEKTLLLLKELGELQREGVDV